MAQTMSQSGWALVATATAGLVTAGYAVSLLAQHFSAPEPRQSPRASDAHAHAQPEQRPGPRHTESVGMDGASTAGVSRAHHARAPPQRRRRVASRTRAAAGTGDAQPAPAPPAACTPPRATREGERDGASPRLVSPAAAALRMAVAISPSARAIVQQLRHSLAARLAAAQLIQRRWRGEPPPPPLVLLSFANARSGNDTPHPL